MGNLKWRCACLLFSFFFIFSCSTEKISFTRDLDIEFSSGPVAADRGSVRFIRIRPQGSTNFLLEYGKKYAFYSMHDGRRLTKEGVSEKRVLTEKQVRDLVEQFNRSGFFDLKESYQDPDILDGDFKRLYIRLGDMEKNVVCVNVSVKRFTVIENSLKGLLP